MTSSYTLQKHPLVGPVTAVEFSLSGSVVFVGIGSCIHAYGVHDGRLCGSFVAIDGRVVHGMDLTDEFPAWGTVGAIFGQKKVAIFGNLPETAPVTQVHDDASAADDEWAPESTPRQGRACLLCSVPELGDVVWDARLFSPSGPRTQSKTGTGPSWEQQEQQLPAANCGLDFELAVGTAHNVVELWQISGASEGGECAVTRLIRRVRCVEDGVLFTLSLHGRSWGALQAAAGTAMHDVLVWRPSVSEPHPTAAAPGVEAFAQVEQCLTGHSGCLKRVRWAADGRSLASCADDRTVRLWTCQQAAGEDEDDAPRSSRRFTLQWIGWGHRERLWDVRFCGVEPGQNQRLVTASADSTCKVWDVAADCCLATLDGHAGQHIWRVAVHSGSSESEDKARSDPLAREKCRDSLRVVTGGNDASAQVWEAQLHFGNTSRTNGQSCAATVLQGVRHVYTVDGQSSSQRTGANDDNTSACITDTVAFELAPELVALPIVPATQVLTSTAASAAGKQGALQCRRNQRCFLRFLREVLMNDIGTPPALETTGTRHTAPSFTMFDTSDNDSRASEVPLKAKGRNAPKAAVRSFCLCHRLQSGTGSRAGVVAYAATSDGKVWRATHADARRATHTTPRSMWQWQLVLQSACAGLLCTLAVDDRISEPQVTGESGANEGELRHNLAMGSPTGVAAVLLHRGADDTVPHLLQWQAHATRVAHMLWPRATLFGESCCLLTAGADGLMKCWGLGAPGQIAASGSNDLCDTHAPVRLLATFAAAGKGSFMCAVVPPSKRHMFCGDNRGNLYAFDIAANTQMPAESRQASFLARRAHGRDAVTLLRFHESYLFSAGQDGYVRQYSVEQEPGAEFRLRLVGKFSAAPVVAVEELWWAADGTMMVSGFYASDFIVVDLVRCYVFARWRAGGWKRPHASWVDPDCPLQGMALLFAPPVGKGSTSPLVHIKSTLCSPAAMSHWAFHEPHHGGVATCACWIVAGNHASENGGGGILLSGSQDNTLRLSVFGAANDTQSVVRRSLSREGHSAGIRAMAVSSAPAPARAGEYLVVTVGGKEELTCWAVLPAKSAMDSANAAATSLPRVEWLCTHAHEHASETQRLTAVAIVQHCCIITCNSEGIVRFFVLVPTSAAAGATVGAVHCVCVSEQKLCDQPILSCAHVTVASRHVLSCGTTGGEVLLWDITPVVQHCAHDLVECRGAPTPWPGDLLRPVLRYQAHEMGVNCLTFAPWAMGDAHAADSGEADFLDADGVNAAPALLVVSGGDDQALCVAGVRQPRSASLGSSATVALELAFAERVASSSSCSIDGVYCDGRHIMCAGCDQRLDVWALHPPPTEAVARPAVAIVDPAKPSCCTLRTACCVEVPDIGDLCVFRRNGDRGNDPHDSSGAHVYEVAVVGEGLQRVTVTVAAHTSPSPTENAE